MHENNRTGIGPTLTTQNEPNDKKIEPRESVVSDLV